MKKLLCIVLIGSLAFANADAKKMSKDSKERDEKPWIEWGMTEKQYDEQMALQQTYQAPQQQQQHAPGMHSARQKKEEKGRRDISTSFYEDEDIEVPAYGSEQGGAPLPLPPGSKDKKDQPQQTLTQQLHDFLNRIHKIKFDQHSFSQAAENYAHEKRAYFDEFLMRNDTDTAPAYLLEKVAKALAKKRAEIADDAMRWFARRIEYINLNKLSSEAARQEITKIEEDLEFFLNVLPEQDREFTKQAQATQLYEHNLGAKVAEIINKPVITQGQLQVQAGDEKKGLRSYNELLKEIGDLNSEFAEQLITEFVWPTQQELARLSYDQLDRLYDLWDKLVEELEEQEMLSQDLLERCKKNPFLVIAKRESKKGSSSHPAVQHRPTMPSSMPSSQVVGSVGNEEIPAKTSKAVGADDRKNLQPQLTRRQRKSGQALASRPSRRQNNGNQST